MTKKSVGLPPHRKIGQSRGGNSLVTDHKIARNGTGEIEGTAAARHHTVKPSASSGSIGRGQPIKENSGYKDGRMSTLGRPHIKTKSSR